ncbi:hypothetical protein H310_07432 [Aphanomyces invadans]|uniref:Uncharacterized protein n=1 Tax=Aphanomyces invadans TaxID=157072 RepID=A0A024U316_9STRA|nr:hypothetical protein H310_07432 [Aphanomyces invadans]ETV99982.1 hypothetical protein H310_07432 [Aphanomyces invadans]|eukprot:XP_008871400.1 hypothetical protein H310_07432 [Aphanomyces invadans]
MTDHRRCRAAAIAVVVAATAQAQLVTTMTTPPPPPSEGNGLRPGVVVGLVVGVVVVGAILVYGGIYFLKQHTLRGAAALSTDKVVTTNDAQAYFGPARQSDDFDVYFGKQPSMVTNMASHPCVKLGSSRATAATVAVDINVPTKPASSRALPPTTVHHVKLDAVMSPQHSSVADDAPSDMVTAMRSYRSMIQQQTMGVDIAWMSPVESSRSLFPSQRAIVDPTSIDDVSKLEWLSAMESTRTTNLAAFDSMRNVMDLAMDEEASEASCRTTFNL